jgi:TIR domain
MPSIFLSYSQKDLKQAMLLEQQLKSRGVSVWRDQTQLLAGQRWPKRLGEEIAKRDALLLLWSGNAADSNFVELEWTTALALKKEILPCTLDETPLPASLAAVQKTSCNDVSDAANEIADALSHEKPQADLRANTKKVIDKLARIRSTNVAEVLQEFRVIHGSVYQAGGDIYVGSQTPL